MRLCFVTDSGDCLHSRRWISAFVRRGIDVHVVVDLAGLDVPGTQVHVLPPPRPVRGTARVQQLLAIRTLVRRLGVDVVHSFPLTPFASLASFAGAPHVVTLWGSDMYKHGQARRLPLIKRACLSRAACVTADSRDLCGRAARAGTPWTRIHLIQFGVDLEAFRPIRAQAENRARLGIPESVPVVLSPRGFWPIYNPEVIVEAAAQVERSGVDAFFVLLAGTGDRGALERLVRSKLSRAIVIGSVPHEEMADLYGLASVCVSIPTWDGTPVSLLEAMASGCIPVVSDTHSAREWVEDGDNGFVVPIDASALARAVTEAVGHRRAAEIARRNRTTIEERADHNVEMDRMAQLYREVAGRE